MNFTFTGTERRHGEISAVQNCKHKDQLNGQNLGATRQRDILRMYEQIWTIPFISPMNHVYCAGLEDADSSNSDLNWEPNLLKKTLALVGGFD